MPGKKYKWPIDKEDILIQRFEDHPFMFDMGESDYHDNDKKTEFLKDVAKELGVPASQVEKRWRSFRSNHGRLVKELKEGKSGSGAKTMSTRKKWLVKRLSFLNKHIKTRTTKSSLDYVQNEEEEEEDVATPGTSGMNDDQEVTEATPQTDEDGEEEEEEGEENSVVAADEEEEEEEVPNQDCDNADDEEEEEEEEEEGEDAEATSQVEGEDSKQKIIDLLHTPDQADKKIEGQDVPGSAQPSQSDPESQDVQDNDELPTIDPVKKDGDSVPNPAGSHDSEDDDSDIQKNLPYKEDGTLEEEVIVETAKDNVKESDSGQKRQLEVWEEDLLPPPKKIKVIKEEKTNTSVKKLKKTAATSTKADVKAGNSKEELTDEQLRARPPTPPPKEDEKKVPVVKKKKSHDDSGGEPKTKDKVHKPTPAKTKKALKTLQDFKALVADDDDNEDDPQIKIVNPKPPKKVLEDTSGAKKDKKGGKNKDPAKAIVQKKGEAPQRLTMTVKKDLAEVNKKNKDKDKDKNEARLDSLEDISDRRLNIVEKVVESWDEFGKRMSQGGGSDGKAQQPVILPMKAQNDFTDEENFWSGLMVTKLRRVRDREVRDDVMLQCEQLVNDAIRNNRKKDVSVEMNATTTTNIAAAQGSSSQSLTAISQVAQNGASKCIPTASSSHRGNAAASSSSASATATSTSQRGPQSFTAMLSTPPRAVDNQYAVMQNVQASNLHPSMQQALPIQGYGQGMWPPGSPSIPQVYCNNYYGGYSTNVPGHDMQGQMGQK